MVEKRNVAIAIILSIVTCGIYNIIWFIHITDDTNTVSNNPADTSGIMSFLLTLVTCGIYGWVWFYRMGAKLDQASSNRGMPTQARGIVYLLLGLFGLGIVSFALMQDSINKLA